MLRTAAAVVCLSLALGSSAHAEDKNVPSSLCVDVSVPKGAIAAHDGKWIELTPEQWQFMRGIYAMNPATPPGLPYGDKAVLAKVDGDEGGLVFFIDGDKACTPMPVPKALLDMIDAVAKGKIEHEGSPL
jgi:hypothetical protein